MDEVSPSNEGKDLGGGSGGADDLSAVAMAAAAGLSWRPRQLAFSPYYTVNKVQALRVVVRRPVSVLASFFFFLGVMLLLLQVILASIFKFAICMLKFEFWELSMLVLKYGGKIGVFMWL